MKKKFIITLFLTFAILFITKDTYAFDVNNYRYRQLCGTYEVSEFKEDGNIEVISCHESYEQAKTALRQSGDNAALLHYSWGEARIIDANVAMVDLSVNPDTLTYFYNNLNLNGDSFTYMDTGSLYGGVDGDSASSTEIYAILSSLSDSKSRIAFASRILIASSPSALPFVE